MNKKVLLLFIMALRWNYSWFCCSVCVIPNLQLIFWCGDFVESMLTVFLILALNYAYSMFKITESVVTVMNYLLNFTNLMYSQVQVFLSKCVQNISYFFSKNFFTVYSPNVDVF